MSNPFAADPTKRNYRTIRARAARPGAQGPPLRHPGLTTRSAFEPLARAADGRESGCLARRCAVIRR
jgi:hypothetical protein